MVKHTQKAKYTVQPDDGTSSVPKQRDYPTSWLTCQSKTISFSQMSTGMLSDKDLNKECLKMKQTKLIAGQMNIPYIICKPGYAEGSNKPKRERKVKAKQVVTRLRKQEGLYV